jgi:hypothetical protein
MIDMIGQEVYIDDKVIYTSTLSKELKIGYLIREIGPRKGIVYSKPLREYIKTWKDYYDKKGISYTEEDLLECKFGDKTVISKQIYKI